MAEAKERPILFSAPMVRAILDNRKTQTRRAIKPQPTLDYCEEYGYKNKYGYFVPIADALCKFGAPGDRLWVRETWAQYPIDFPPQPEDVWYKADGRTPPIKCDLYRWRPSIHMPRWASRITLEITEVRAQRLQDISEEDARAEGVRGNSGGSWGCEGLIEDFSDLWESINGAGSWELNPFVWCISFKKLTP